MDSTGGLSIFCLDQTEAAFRSEDFPGNRWRYQLDVMDALAERLHLQHDLCPDAAHLAGRRCTFRQHHSLCALSASRAKLLCPPTRLSDRAQCMARLRGMLPVSKGLNASLTSVLRLAALVARAYHPSSITAFIAGPCSIAAEDAVDLAGALAGHSLTIVSLASPAELGEACIAALQRLTSSPSSVSENGQQAECQCSVGGMPAAATWSCAGSLSTASEGSEQDNCCSGNSGVQGHAASAHRLPVCRVLFVEPPGEGLEPWQQLERVLESLEAAPVHGSAAECAQHADRAGCRPVSRAGQALGMSNAEVREGVGATIASSRAPGSRAAQSAGPHSQQAVSRAAQPPAAAAQWHGGRALLARRSGVHSPAVCRHESLDALGHLSSDGCMRPWLPSYANLPKPQETPAARPWHEAGPQAGPGGRACPHAGATEACASSQCLAGSPAQQGQAVHGSRSNKQEPRPQHAPSSSARSEITLSLSYSAASPGLLRIFLGRPDPSALQAAGEQRCEGSACIGPSLRNVRPGEESLNANVDLVRAAAAAEQGGETGQDASEDCALYELD